METITFSDFPPWNSVYKYFRKLVNGKYLDSIMFKLNYKYIKFKRCGSNDKKGTINQRNETSIRRPLPNFVLVTDSQSVRDTDMSSLDNKGYDGNKKVKGIKRFLLVDLLGCVWNVFTTRANVSEKIGLRKLVNYFSSIRARPKQFTVILADKGFESKDLEDNLAQCQFKLLAMKSTKRLKKDNVDNQYNIEQIDHVKKLNKCISSYRWIVERAFAFLDKARRLIINYERKTKIHEGFVKLNCIRLLVRRLRD